MARAQRARPARHGRLQHAHPPGPAADADQQSRPGVAEGRGAPREGARTSTTSRSRATRSGATTSRARSPTSSTSRRRTRHDDRGRDARRLRDRRPGRALPLAAHAQRGLRGARPRPRLRRAARRARPTSGRRCAASRRSASTAPTSRSRTRPPPPRCATSSGDEARDAGAVNTLSFSAGGGLRGDLTDGLGLVAALGRGARARGRARRRRQRARGRRSAAAGRDAAAHGRRAPPRGGGRAGRRAGRPRSRRAGRGGGGGARGERGGLLVNCTPVGGIADLKAASGACRCDRANGRRRRFRLPRRWLADAARRRAALAAGLPVVDGLELLVRQGALSFRRWTGIEPPLDVMRRAARGE